VGAGVSDVIPDGGLSGSGYKIRTNQLNNSRFAGDELLVMMWEVPAPLE